MAHFQTFHEGSSLGLLEKACLASLVHFGHFVTLYSYHALEAPEGVRLADARAIIAESERDAFFRVAPGRVSQFSNGFRYHLLDREGGWWVDTDVLCLGGDFPEREIILGWATEKRIGNSIMRLPPGHELARQAADFWQQNWEVKAWGVTGPVIITTLVERLGLSDLVLPFGDLFKIPWNDVLLLFDPACRAEVIPLLRDCSLLHLANSGLTFTGLRRNILPPPGSALRPYLEPFLTRDELAEGDTAFIAAIVSGFRTLQMKLA